LPLVPPSVVIEQEALAMSQDVRSLGDRSAPSDASDTQRLREIRERLKRLERELSKMPSRRAPEPR
jgi:hypothetical protein